MKRLSIVVAFGFGFLAGCAGVAPPDPAASRVTVEHTGGGLSTSPLYDLTLFPDGRVVFEGHSWVRKKQRLTKRISPARVAPVFAQIESLPLAQLKDSYSFSESADGNTVLLMPSDTAFDRLTIVHRGTTRTIENLHFAPPELTALVRLIRDAAAVDDWIGQSNERMF